MTKYFLYGKIVFFFSFLCVSLEFYTLFYPNLKSISKQNIDWNKMVSMTFILGVTDNQFMKIKHYFILTTTLMIVLLKTIIWNIIYNAYVYVCVCLLVIYLRCLYLLYWVWLLFIYICSYINLNRQNTCFKHHFKRTPSLHFIYLFSLIFARFFATILNYNLAFFFSLSHCLLENKFY